MSEPVIGPPRVARLIGVIEPVREPVSREVLVDLVRDLMAWCPADVTMSARASKLFSRAQDALSARAPSQAHRPARRGCPRRSDRGDSLMRALRLVGDAREALRGRARAQVAENVRAVRGRIRSWRARRDPATAAPRSLESQAAAPEDVTYPGRRVSTPGPTSRAHSRRTLRILVAVVALSAVHTFISTPAAAGAVGMALLVGGGMALHGIFERRWPVVARRRR